MELSEITLKTWEAAQQMVAADKAAGAPLYETNRDAWLALPLATRLAYYHEYETS